MSKQCAVEERRSRSGLYLGPWAVRVLAGLLGLSAVTGGHGDLGCGHGGVIRGQGLWATQRTDCPNGMGSLFSTARVTGTTNRS